MNNQQQEEEQRAYEFALVQRMERGMTTVEDARYIANVLRIQEKTDERV